MRPSTLQSSPVFWDGNAHPPPNLALQKAVPSSGMVVRPSTAEKYRFMGQ